MTPEQKRELVEGQKEALELIRERIAFEGYCYRSRVAQYRGDKTFEFMIEWKMNDFQKWRKAERVLLDTIAACNADGPWFNFAGERVA